MRPLHLLKCYEYLVTSSWPDQTNTILFAFLYYKVGRTSLILLFPVPSFGLKYLSQWVAERSCPAGQCSPVTLQKQILPFDKTSILVLRAPWGAVIWECKSNQYKTFVRYTVWPQYLVYIYFSEFYILFFRHQISFLLSCWSSSTESKGACAYRVTVE